MNFRAFVKKRTLGLISFLYSLAVALFWTAERINWAGISKALGADTNQSFLVMNLPLLLCILLWLLAALSFYGLIVYEKKKRWSVITLITSIVFTLAILVIIYLGSIDYISFIWYHFVISLCFAVLLLCVALLLFFPNDGRDKKTLWLKTGILVLSIALAVLAGYKLRPNRFNYGAVVYAVEDEYQIVFSTNDNSIAWAEIGGEKYYDLYAGSMKSKDLVHKICVPQSALDKAGSYTVFAQKMIYRGPFGGYKGRIISQSYSFRPVDGSDGYQYFALSDIHQNYKGAIAAADTGLPLDFLIIIGDTVSMVERFEDAEAVSYVAHEVTKGEIPVVFARGNHDIKGEYAEDLYKYVGSKDGKFYYTFRLAGIKGIVLDLGEDHDDDWWEYYETAQFDLYRDEQTEMLKQLRDEHYFDGCDYSMVLCHIPIQFVNARKNHEPYKNEWTAILNEMGVDIALYGHQHDLTVFEPGLIKAGEKLTYNKNYYGREGKTYNGYLTDFNFYGFMVGKAALDQKSEPKLLTTREFTGLYVSARNGRSHCFFMNSRHEKVPVCNMFGTDELHEDFDIGR